MDFSDKQVVSQTLRKSIEAIVVALTFAVPLFFLPITVEFFEFNKLVLITMLTVIGTLLWTANALLGQRVSFAKSALDLPLLILAFLMVGSTVFSVDKASSIFGASGRWFPSLFGFFILVAFYYLTASNLSTKNIATKVVHTLLISITLVSLISVVSYFELYPVGVPFFQPNFSTTGVMTTTALLASLAIVLALSVLVNLIPDEEILPTRAKFKKILLGVAVMVNFSALILLNTLSGWMVLFVGIVAFFLLTNLARVRANKTALISIVATLIIVGTLTLLPFVRAYFVNENFPMEATLPIKESWIVATSALRDFPITGTGPSTFHLNFTRYRPISLNDTNAWGLRFDKPVNEFFNVMGTLGVIGLLAAIFFAVKAFSLARLPKSAGGDEDGLAVTLNILIVVTLASFVFHYATVLTTFILFLVLGLKVARVSQKKKEALGIQGSSTASTSPMTSLGNVVKVEEEYRHIIFAAPFIAMALVATFLTHKIYLSEYYMRQSVNALQAGDGARAYDLQTRAINNYPKKDTYHNTYAQTSLLLANTLSAQQDLTEEEKQTIQTLLAQAIRSSRISTEILVPGNVSGWEIRGNIYRNLMGAAADSESWAVSSYETAILLDPTNPRLRLDLGGIYFSLGDYLSAANQFRQAINLKPDYANAHFNFAQSLIQLKDYENAKRSLEAIKNLVPVDSEDYQLVLSEIQRVESLPTVAGAETTSEMGGQVEEVTQAAEQQVEIPTEQEPLTNVGEEAAFEEERPLSPEDSAEIVEAVSETEIQAEEEAKEKPEPSPTDEEPSE